MAVHGVIGSGPLGRATARELSARGLQVRLVSRNPRPEAALETVRADATDVASLVEALEGVSVVYHCANAPYHRWTQDLPPIWRGIHSAARSVGARLVIANNLYSYGEPDGPFTESTAFLPCSRKGKVRAMLEREALELHTQGELQLSLVRASDFYGPEVLESQLGDRFFGPLTKGKPAKMVGVRGALHSYTYIADVARTLAEVGSRDDSWGRTWLAPTADPASGDDLEAILRGSGMRGSKNATIQFAGKGFLRFGGLFVPAARELIEMFYEFDRDFTVDSSGTEKQLGIAPTPLDRGLTQTLEWYQTRSSSAAIPVTMRQ